MPLNTVGCGRYSAQVWTRGGASLVFERLPVSSVKWSRVLNDTSAASVTLDGIGRTPACFAAIRDADPGQHELAIIRDGELVWQGPIFTKSGQGTSGGYEARDLSLWWDHRRLPFDREYLQTDLATIFEDLATDAMAEDSSPNVTVSATATGVLGNRKYLAGQHLMAGPQLRELSQAGVDWTVIVRSVVVGGTTIPTDPIVLLNDRHLTEPPKVEKQFPTGNRIGMAGAGGGEAPDAVFGEASDADSIATYGLLDDVESNDSVRDDASAAAAAGAALALGKIPVQVLSDVSIDSSAPVLVSQLVPGAIVGCTFATSPIEVAGTFRLSKVDVDVSRAVEKVVLTLQPLGVT